MKITRFILPIVFAAALAACKSKPKAGPCELVKPRNWPTFFGYTKEKIPNCPKIVEKIVKEPYKEPVRIVQPGMTAETPKPAMKPDPLAKYNETFSKVGVLIDFKKGDLKKKKVFKKLQRAYEAYKKKKSEKNGNAMVKAYADALKALEKRSGGRRRRPMWNGMKPKNGMKPENGMKPVKDPIIKWGMSK